MSGDRRKRKQALDSFISALKAKREEFRKEKKTGAGSATEAIEFYEYALEKNRTWKGSDDGSNSSNEDNVSCKAKCKVCNQGGDLFRCSQSVCDNYFHVECVRPHIDAKPQKDWSCAFCDVDYVTGLKPQARKRRISVSAVRAMEKTRADIESGRIVPKEFNTATKKRKFDDLHINDSEAGAMRSQRQRRTKVIFDPQASDDEEETSLKEEEQVQVIDKDEIPIDILKKLSPKCINTNSKHGQFHCKFCMDDEATETCCFCACRVCFSKRDRDRTILCDICDAEYHTDCLSPPLEKIPTTDWFCPTCVNVITKLQNDPKRGKNIFNSPKPAKDNVKLVKKTKTTKSSNRSELKANYASKQPRLPCGRFAPKNFASPDKVVKRGPGRPPKSASQKQITPKKPGTGRPRGRPPKNAARQKSTDTKKEKKEIPSSSSSDVQTTTPKKRGRGRPPSVSKATKIEIIPTEKVESDTKEKNTEKVTVDMSNKPTLDERKPSLKESNETSTVTKVADESGPHEGKRNISEPLNKEIAFQKQENPFVQNSKEPMNETAIKNATVAAINAVAKKVETKDENPTPNSNNSKSTMSKTTSQQPPQRSISVSSSTNQSTANPNEKSTGRVPRRKPGARECMQISRRFGANVISQQYMETLLVSSHKLQCFYSHHKFLI